MEAEITPADVRRIFTYRDGFLIWNLRPRSDFRDDLHWNGFNTRFSGKVAGSLRQSRSGLRRYISITHKGKRHTVAASRLIWVWHHRMWPGHFIDHIDGDTTNDRLPNLRDVSANQNAQNQKKHRSNSSGRTGIYWVEGRKLWEARIQANGARHYLGYFMDKKAAIAAREKAEVRFGFHKNHGGVPTIRTKEEALREIGS